MVRARHVLVDQFGLGDRGAEVDVPQRRRLLLVRLAASQVAQERRLAGADGLVADRLVEVVPVDREAEAAEQLLEGDLVVGHEPLAQLDEVRSADRDLVLRVGLGRRLEVGVERQRRVAADAEEVLDAPLGGQAVVVPADRVEDVAAAHPLVAGDGVGVGVAEDVSDVQRAGDGGRRRVDREDRVTAGGAVERVRAVGCATARPSARRGRRASACRGRAGSVRRCCSWPTQATSHRRRRPARIRLHGV